jgi:cyclin A
MVDIAANTYERSEIVSHEMAVSQALGFRLGGVTASHFLVHFLRAAAANPKQEAFAWYLAELALLSYDFVGLKPSAVAAAVVHLTRQTLLPRASPLRGAKDAIWTPALEYYTRCASPDVEPIVRLLHSCHLRAWEGSYAAVRVKNTRPERFHVSDFVTCLPKDELRF